LNGTPQSSHVVFAATDGTMCKILYPTRIWNQISVHMYSIIKVKVPNTLRTLFNSISKYDGYALIQRLRQPNQTSNQTPIKLLELRKSNIQLHNYSSWESVKGELVTLFDDYTDKIAKGEVPEDEKMSLRKQKDLIVTRCDDVLFGLAEWVGNPDNADVTLERTLKQCDTIADAGILRLERKRGRGEEPVSMVSVNQGEVSMYAANPSTSTVTAQRQGWQGQGWQGQGWQGKGWQGNGWQPGKGYQGNSWNPTYASSKGKGKGKGKGAGKGTEKGKGKGQSKGKGGRWIPDTYDGGGCDDY
jgi:hypothetical protein